MLKYISITLFSCILICFSLDGYGQIYEENMAGKDSAVIFYRNSVGEHSSLYKGRVYGGLNIRVQGHQFFGSNEWQNASLFYKGNLYKDVPVLYDIFKDELLVLHSDGFLKIQVLKSELEYFTISNHSFRHIRQKDLADTLIEAGIYDQIYKGDHSVLVKRRKKIKETINQMEVIREFEHANQYYIKKGDSFHLIHGKGSVLRLFKHHKKEIRKKLRANKIKFRRDPEYAIVKMVEFYEQAVQ